MRYYEPGGFRAEDKKLPLGEFWYTFGESGQVKNIVRIASSSNAEPAITDMTPATPGNAVKLPASGSSPLLRRQIRILWNLSPDRN